MASHVFVIDSAFKRTQLKVTPGKYLREVLEEACAARKLNPESYTLKTQNNKAVDLSQPFRLSGLTAGAKLQLTQASRSTGVVSVALQLPESEGGSRLNDKFPSSTSLWLVLRKFEDAVAGQPPKKLNLTQRGVPPRQTSGSGRLEYESPVVNFMGRNLESFTDLQKTLAQLGINNGSVMMRLSFKNSGQPLEEAMQEIGQYFTSVEQLTAGVGSSATQKVNGTHPMPGDNLQSSTPDTAAEDAMIADETEAFKEPAEPEYQDTPMTEASTQQIIGKDAAVSTSTTQSLSLTSENSPPSNVVNGITVFRPPSSSTPAAALHEDDPSVFEPSIEGAKVHQASLQRASRNTRLRSDKELEEQEEERRSKLALVQNVTVRVRYPDQSMIETTCTASETSADLHAKVMKTLEAAPEPFELRYIGPKGHQNLPNSSSQRLVRDFGFRGKVLVTLVWSPDASLKARQGPSLREEYRSKAQELKVELQSQQASGEQNHREAMAKKDKPDPPTASGSKGKGDIEGKLKKFLGFNKK